ncbi:MULTISPECIES: tyrosine--tRNA ligase [unclassified Actinomyces]|uniref:tyrosine--tRNA ligase n=1 Tax=unclassified Actinomyces TaxID=2609248 RepID=UPI0008A63364|nr:MULTISPECIES: tyrosine--tRNA ligase [unclassified Actinomyces]MDU5231773.1 tyrosine--tRNA ligase [Actinomyces sp.]MDU6757371.1 tyrosine--tRNA ligase [Actinomyces sp.]OFJ61984.1 tyrosine--tRNA ligase [Actinomyces sp. HMSC075B09]
MADLIDDLQWRGLIRQHTDLDKLRKELSSGPVTFYCGFDPTAPSLHHGHLVQLILMRHLQLAGHRPLALVGGATGLIGDPRMSGERTLQPREVVEGWVESLKKQISRFLDFEGENAALMVNNLDWTSELSAIDLLRDLGKFFRMGTMLSKDAVARRLSSKEGISYTEFSYQILQANDYLQLYRRYGCTLETGGDDQWGNLVGGLDLIRKVEDVEVSVMTTPLITKADGTKFGKSEGGAVWLNPDMLSPYAFYQFWLNVDDADVVRFLKVFTFLDRPEIERLEKTVEDAPYKREAQKALAAEVTKLVHGEETLQRVLEATDALWGSGDLKKVDAATLSAATSELPAGEVAFGEATIVDALVAAGLEKGKRAARTTVSSGGAYLNNERVESENQIISAEDALADGTVLIRKGRRNLAVVRPAK